MSIMTPRKTFFVIISNIDQIFFEFLNLAGSSMHELLDNNSNQECKIRPPIININSNERLFYPYSVFVNKWGGSCNDVTVVHIIILMLNYAFLMLLKT